MNISGDIRIRAGYAAALILFVLLIIPHDLQAEDSPVFELFLYQNQLTAAFDLQSVLDSARFRSTKESYPLRLKFRVELKKSQSLWFDHIVDEKQAALEIEYQSFGSRYNLRLLPFDGKPFDNTYLTRNDILEALNERLLLSFGQVDNLNRTARYYLRLEIELKRLSAKDIQDASRWYRGLENDTSHGSGQDFPVQILDNLLNISGFGAEKLVFQSPPFRVSDLKIVKSQN